MLNLVKLLALNYLYYRFKIIIVFSRNYFLTIIFFDFNIIINIDKIKLEKTFVLI